MNNDKRQAANPKAVAPPDLWIKRSGADVPPPDWTNVPNRQNFTSYGWTDGRGAGDARLKISGDVLRLDCVSTFPKEMIPWIMGTVTVVGCVSVCFFPVPPAVIAILLVMTPLCAISTGLLAYSIQAMHEQAGDYLVIDRGARTLELPRQQVTISLDAISRFQLIRGRTASGYHQAQTDLNLLAFAEGNQLLRYYILSSTMHSLVKELSAFSKIPVEELELGRRGNREADRNTT